MVKQKLRTLLIISSILTYALAGGLLFAFVYVCFDGIANGFLSFGVLANFREIMGFMALACLLFGLVLLRFASSELKMSHANIEGYKHKKIILICALALYLCVLVLGIICIFETYSDISAVGTAFLASNIGYFAIAFSVLSLFAFLLVIIDLFTFSHDIKTGVLGENGEPFLLNAPQYRLVYSGRAKNMDYSALESKLKNISALRRKGMIDDAEFSAMKKDIIDAFFKSER